MYYSISEALITYISEYKHLLSYLLPGYAMAVEIYDGDPNKDFIIIKIYGTMKDFKLKRTIYEIERAYCDGLEPEVKRKAYIDVMEVKNNDQ